MSNHTPIQLPLAIDGLTVEIPLTRGYVAVIDAVDADLALRKWQVHKPEGVRPAYAVRDNSSKNGSEKPERMHRIILAQMLERTLSSREHVDHIDGDGLNNRRSNLRAATCSQNVANAFRKHGVSGYRGVTPVGKRRAGQIMVNRRHIHLGTFDTPELAYEAYCKAAREYFGEFARLE